MSSLAQIYRKKLIDLNWPSRYHNRKLILAGEWHPNNHKNTREKLTLYPSL